MEMRKASRTAITEWSAAIAQQLLTRHGVVTRETVASEGVPGGFSAVYDVLKTMEEAGRVRRGYFVAGLGGAQFALPPAVDLLRTFRDLPESSQHVILAATDPANPFGAVLKWPFDTAQGRPFDAAQGRPFDAAQGRPFDTATRSVGARVILVDGLAAGYLRRGERELLLAAPEAEPQRSRIVHHVARALLELASAREPGQQGLLIAEVNGEPAATHQAAHLFVQEGFAITAMGLQARIAPSRRYSGDVPGRHG
jgi:ATP-dependent Lhr-like helicase